MNFKADPEATGPIPPALYYSFIDQELDHNITNLPKPDSYMAIDKGLHTLYLSGEYDQLMGVFKLL